MNKTISQNKTHRNPFFEPFNTIHNTFPFHCINIADYKEAIIKGISLENEEINNIANNPDAPTFNNTIVAMEKVGELLGKSTTVFFNLLNTETCDEMDSLAQELSPLLSEHSNNIMLNAKLFKRIKTIYEGTEELTPEEKMLLEKTYEGFLRSGASLCDQDKDKLRLLTMEASKLTLQFSQNNLKETNAYTLHLTKEADLKGLPETQKEQAAITAKEKELNGWVFTLQAPSYSPFMTYADNRELRKELYLAYNTKCTQHNEYNNLEIVRRLVNLRRELAQLLGYKSYAEYALKRRMAENSKNVNHLLDQLIEAYKEPAKAEIESITKMAEEIEGLGFILEPWDISYYSHKLQLAKYNLDAEMLRPYFELSKVKAGVFGLATTLYGITFKENNHIPVYNKDVKAYEIFDKDGSYLAVLYTDFHPRESKQGGAWMTSYQEQHIEENGENIRPHVSITMNFTKPTDKKPALLTLGEVETFLHEFGHALQGIFANTRFESLSGTNVYWDFVELPSQIMENFAIEKDFLQTFATHYKTGEIIPNELIERIRESRNYNIAYTCMRQISFCLLDMAYYTQQEPFTEDIIAFEKKAWQRAMITKQLPHTCMSVQFCHIMAGGYAAGYYSYKWAEVLDADAFSLFKEKGIFNKEVAQSFRDNILSKGGTMHPMELYKRFRGKTPSIDALLKRNGIKNENI
ncbi:MAG: M3 family metallopeptidase [Bacteroidaceae bacterium]